MVRNRWFQYLGFRISRSGRTADRRRPTPPTFLCFRAFDRPHQRHSPCSFGYLSFACFARFAGGFARFAGPFLIRIIRFLDSAAQSLSVFGILNHIWTFPPFYGWGIGERQFDHCKAEDRGDGLGTPPSSLRTIWLGFRPFSCVYETLSEWAGLGGALGALFDGFCG